ncbi:hypothetical protein, variant [Puccinia triticina 1-1 BBBD Race 1]|uniref:DUF1752 domain-containing protein n=2 Tax=Puccinia triticina TaxID=208348 RepID=A0A180H5K7_PUCT1|nr:uncharacterized protein PtA15_2A528 [Puccinia triticina]OAV99713.1 hypothetical protein PTTG_00500 [Puccinia triticina 1-1 BBBD Race 1]OAV99714.1 hypothetical protein, variant [Puccinia triticina 1-1 BBBD Race 1]WAQ82211.1 hypothetical protein PtA15_2A528 [Puccinia triticina]WAR53066.1 hypothetical protein PtB15_2B496 [Puccinia triticina]
MAAVASPPSINVSPPSNPAPHSSSSTTCTLVPQYPYNVSMPSFAGALLPYERSPMPDDNDVQTRLPSRCVDYLSHNWDESDVWTSWKAMTRHKNEMANGIRLENASWRTWAKQRSNLKTISPETLNWLKDSDVTWLYGPLHTAVDPVPPAKISSIQDRFNLDGQPQSTPHSQSASTVNSRPGSSASMRSSKAPGKPILKHRSLSEILGVGLSKSGESASEDGSEDGRARPDQPKRARVSIAHASSDSTLVKLGNASVARGSSPTIINGYESSDLATSGDDSDAARRTSAMRSQSAHSVNGSDDVKPKKHISFSHRVEQCIAVDSEEERGSYTTKGQLRPPGRGGAAVIGSNVLEDEDDDDDEDDLLTFRSSAPRQTGLHAVSQRYMSPSAVGTLPEPYGPLAGPSNLLAGSSASEPFTIARMAPTTLKSSEVLPAPSPVVVYDRDPPCVGVNSQPSYARPTYTVTATPSASIGMDYTMQNPVPQASTNATPIYSHQTSSSYSSRTYGPVAVSKVLASPTTAPSGDHLTSMPIQYGSSSSMNHWNVTTPDDEDTEEFTAMGFDYFSGPDLGLGDEYDMSRLPSQHLASFQAGFNPSEMNGKPGNNEDSTILRSILKTHVASPSSGSPASSPGKFGGQDPILVPQVKSNHKISATHSSSSSSLSSSPFSPRNDSSSSLVTLPNESGILNTDTPLPTFSDCPQNDPDRQSRGRSSSRGSSASSFERSSTDKRPSSHSPTHSPPLSSAGSSTVLAGSNSTNGVVNSSRSSNRPAGTFVRANSYDGGRSFNSKSSLIHAPIGEEDEGDDSQPPAKAGSLEKGLNNLSFRPPQPSTSLPSSNSNSEFTHKPSSSVTLHQSPCMISEPKLATAQLNGSGEGLRGPCSPSNPHGESIASGSPTLFSLLSKQGSSSPVSWWSDERSSNRNTTRSSLDRPSSRPSLRSSNSDSSTSTFIGRTSFSQSDRKFLGTSRGGGSVDEIRCSSEDEFGFGNYYGARSPEDDDLPRDDSENSGVISRAADIVETAKVIVGALWNAGSRSIWGPPESDAAQVDSTDQKDGKSRAQIRRASTGGLHHRSDDAQVASFQHSSAVLDKQKSSDAP